MTDNERRTLIADYATRIAAWVHRPDVTARSLLLETLARMKELAEELPEKSTKGETT